LSESTAGTEPRPQDGAADCANRADPRQTASGAANPVSARERLASWAWIGLGAALVLGFFYLLAPILTPFALAGVLAYLLQPGVDWLQRRGLPRTLGSTFMVVVAAAIALGLVLILLPVLEREALALDRQLPSLVLQLNARVAPLLQQWLGVSLRFDSAALRTLAMQHIGQDFASTLLAMFGSGSLAVLQAIGTLMLVPVVLFYVLLDAQAIKQRLEASIPRRWYPQTMQMLGEIDAVLAQFLRGQLTVMLLLAIYYSVALSIAGFDSALPIGILTGLLIFIPYVGFALGLVLASVVALLEFGTWQAFLEIVLIYGLGQVLEGFFLTPRLVGKRIGLHPLAVIFALLAFGHVFGFFGVLVALPASAVLLVALRRMHRHYLASALYNRT
jgi:predicted PurR-regulated permease PerM